MLFQLMIRNFIFQKDMEPHRFTGTRNILRVQLHPVLQLLSDVLVLPLGQIGDDDTRVKATRVGSHPQLFNRLFFEIQETYIIILLF